MPGRRVVCAQPAEGLLRRGVLHAALPKGDTQRGENAVHARRAICSRKLKHQRGAARASCTASRPHMRCIGLGRGSAAGWEGGHFASGMIRSPGDASMQTRSRSGRAPSMAPVLSRRGCGTAEAGRYRHMVLRERHVGARNCHCRGVRACRSSGMGGGRRVLASRLERWPARPQPIGSEHSL